MILTKNKRIVITLNSHSLTAFQRCPEAFRISDIEHLRLRRKSFPMARGIAIAEFLERYYNAIINEQHVGLEVQAIMADIEKLPFTPEQNGLILTRFFAYINAYRNCDFVPLGTEIGFTKCLYEDKYVQFLYEGRIDLLALTRDVPAQKIVVDHKTTERYEPIYPYNNQVFGYLWAAETELFCYNYIGFQSTYDPAVNYRRISFTMSAAEIEHWRQDTIKTYWRLLSAYHAKSFPRTWQCEGKFKCEYTHICEKAAHPQLVQICKDFQYDKQEYKSW